MAIAEREIGNETTLICVDSYDDQILTGRMYNPVFRRKDFRSTQEFLAEMDTFLNAMSYRPGTVSANISESYQPAVAEDFHKNGSREGERATFMLRILFRQNASWQGKVSWLEGSEEKNFRSALELLKTLDNVLSMQKM